jgi:glutamyl-tRNA synthetase
MPAQSRPPVPTEANPVSVRVRFAPAPSGWLHVGSVRTALFNWLHARRQGGTFVFRIEDTDASRATTESMDSMLDAMAWLGLDWDEGVRVGGPYGPYRQSERAALHTAVARRLEATGHLYRDARSGDELAAWRDARRADGMPPIVKRSSTPEATGAGQATLRLALPESGSIVVPDLVRGAVTWDWAHESDPVLVRSDGSVTYPLANTTDDIAQGITLVCRGEDLLSVTPRQVYLYDLLLADGLIDDALEEVGLPARGDGWTHPTEFAHLSMIVGADRKKLSKRHGSVAIQQFARRGFLPETLVNYIALLGWAPGDGRERMSRDEMVEAFAFEQVGRAAAAFDVDKLTAFNGERIRDLPEEELAERLMPYLDGTYPPEPDEPDDDLDDVTAVPHEDPDAALISRPPTDAERAIIRGLVPIVQERMQTLAEVQRYAPAFFADAVEIEPDAIRKVLAKAGAVEAIEAAREVLADLEPWTTESIEEALRALPERLGIGFGKVAQPIRVAATGSTVSPPLFESLALLNRQVVLDRLDAALPVAQQAQAG